MRFGLGDEDGFGFGFRERFRFSGTGSVAEFDANVARRRVQGRAARARGAHCVRSLEHACARRGWEGYVAEGFCSQGRNRKSRYYTAFGSAREVLACLEVAQAMGINPAIDPDISDRLDRIIRTLCRLSQ